MNSTIKTIFTNFKVNGVTIPVSFLKYDGTATTYVVYLETDKDNSYSADDELMGYVDYYDFNIYSKGNYLQVVEAVKNLLKQNGFRWQPSRDSADMYEDDTGYYHKTICFAIERND